MPPSPWPRIARLVALFAAEGASLGLFACTVGGTRWLPGFIAHNEVQRALRKSLLFSTVTSAVIAVVVFGVFLGFARWKQRDRPWLDATLDRASWLGRLLAFSLFLWAVPPMLSVKGWVDRDLTFLVCAALVVIGFERAMRVSLGAAAERASAMRDASALLSRLPRWGPHVCVTLAIVGYIAYMSHYTVLHHEQRRTSCFDLGYFDTFFWNTIHGRPFYCPITHARDGSYLSIHAEFAVYLLAPFYALAPRAATLLVMQSVMLGLSALPLYLFGRRRLSSDWIAAIVAIAFLLYPALHAPNFADFHFLTISAFFVLWAAYFLISERWVWFWLSVACTLLCREDLPFGGIGVGAALFLSGWRRRTGLALALISATYFVVVKLVIMPRFGEPSFVYIYEKLIPAGESGFSAVAKTLVVNPLFALATILLPQKIPFLLHVFVPLAFLPLRRARFWFLLFPGFFVTMLSTGYTPVIEIRYQYVTHFTPYVFVGTVLMLEELARTAGETIRRAAVTAMAAGTLLATHQFGALQQGNFFSGAGKIRFKITDQEREAVQNLREIAKSIPADGSVAATEHDGPHLSGREHMFTLKYDAQGADYLVYSYDDLWLGKAREIVADALRRGTHGFHAESPGYVALRRGAPTGRNAELLQKVGR